MNVAHLRTLADRLDAIRIQDPEAEAASLTSLAARMRAAGSQYNNRATLVENLTARGAAGTVAARVLQIVDATNAAPTITAVLAMIKDYLELTDDEVTQITSSSDVVATLRQLASS